MALNWSLTQPAKTNPPSADYPYGSARNVTTSGDGTGFAWEQAPINDIGGFLQSLISKAGITLTNVPDTALASQYFDGMRRTAGYPGFIEMTALNADPATLGVRVLVLDGSVIFAPDYPELVANTYIGDANNSNPNANGFIKTSDAAGTTPSVGGPYFKLPDCRGCFVRARDAAAGVDPDGATRLMAEIQAWAEHDHTHEYEDTYQVGTFDVDITLDPGTGVSDIDYAFTATKITAGSNTTAANLSAVETRPVNVAFNLVVWY